MMTAPTLQIKRLREQLYFKELENSQLEARIKELEAALRPFAIVYDNAVRVVGNHSDQLATHQLHFRRAYKVYGKLAAERPEVE